VVICFEPEQDTASGRQTASIITIESIVLGFMIESFFVKVKYY
jgi:hypothetical protein